MQVTHFLSRDQNSDVMMMHDVRICIMPATFHDTDAKEIANNVCVQKNTDKFSTYPGFPPTFFYSI